MIKEIVIGLFSEVPNRIEADRFYLRHEGPDVVRLSGPWLRRYESYRAYDPPLEAVERFGARGGRYTELWFSNIEEYRSRPPGTTITLPPLEKWRQKYRLEKGRLLERTMAIVPVLPTERFLVKYIDPEENPFIRWVCAIKYPEGVNIEEGEKWYLNVHSKELLNQPGLLGFYGYRCLDSVRSGPGGSPSDDSPLEETSWVRVVEFWYEDLSAWRRALVDYSFNYSLPPWGGSFPFVEMRSIFIDLKPDVDFLKGNYFIP